MLIIRRLLSLRAGGQERAAQPWCASILGEACGGPQQTHSQADADVYAGIGGVALLRVLACALDTRAQGAAGADLALVPVLSLVSGAS